MFYNGFLLCMQCLSLSVLNMTIFFSNVLFFLHCFLQITFFFPVLASLMLKILLALNLRSDRQLFYHAELLQECPGGLYDQWGVCSSITPDNISCSKRQEVHKYSQLISIISGLTMVSVWPAPTFKARKYAPFPVLETG